MYDYVRFGLGALTKADGIIHGPPKELVQNHLVGLALGGHGQPHCFQLPKRSPTATEDRQGQRVVPAARPLLGWCLFLWGFVEGWEEISKDGKCLKCLGKFGDS